MKTKKTVLFVTQAGLIAALYIALTALSASLGLSSGVIQFRISEALSVLPFFTPAAIPGLALGCALANAMTGSLPLDVIFGSFATLCGAAVTWLIGRCPARKKTCIKLLATIPNVAANVLVVPWVLRLVYSSSDALWFMAITVGVGEVVAGAVPGFLLILLLERKAPRLLSLDR